MVTWGDLNWGWSPGEGKRWRGEVVAREATAIALGNFHGLALHRDGTVTSWGANFSGQAQVPRGLSGVTAIAATMHQSLALKADGTLVAWGGIHAPPDRAKTGIKAIAGGTDVAIALRADGTVVTWGPYIAPAPEGLSNVVEVVAGAQHVAALKEDGTVVAWGTEPASAGPAPSGLNGVVKIFSGDQSLFALRADGRLVAWGSPSDYSHRVPLDLTDVVSVTATSSHGLALRRDGTVASWGFGGYPELIQVPAGLTDVISVAAGNRLSMALKRDGTIIAWGSASYERQIPTSAVGASAIAARGDLSAAMGPSSLPLITQQPTNRTVHAWQATHFAVQARGFGLAYQWLDQQKQPILGATQAVYHVDGFRIGTGAGMNLPVSVSVRGLDGREVVSDPAELVVESSIAPATFLEWGPNGHPRRMTPETVHGRSVAIATGELTSIAVLSDGSASAWPEDEPKSTGWPAAFPRVQSVAVGDHDSLALMSDHSVRIWPRNKNAPEEIPPIARDDVIAVAASGRFFSVVKSDGSVWQWGLWPLRLLPVSNARAVAGGGQYTVLLRNDGSVAVEDLIQSGPPRVPPPPTAASGVVAIAAGLSHGIALKEDGTVVAWGSNEAGQCNVPADLSRVVAIAAGNHHNVALRDDGTITVWGAHILDRSNPTQLTPVTVPPGLQQVIRIAAGGNQTAVLLGSPASPFLDLKRTEQRLVAIWSDPSASFSLEASSALNGTPWTPVQDPVVDSGLWRHQKIIPKDEGQYLRLIRR